MGKIEIANYCADGLKLRVRLKCSCGGRRIIKVSGKNDVVYQCGDCRAEASFRQLKSEASTYWRGRSWDVECEEQKQTFETVDVDYPAILEAKVNRLSRPYCTLHGHCLELSTSSVLFVANDFRKEYFQELSTTSRFATIQLTAKAQGFPPLLRGSIVEIKFRDEELPACRIRVAFQSLSDETQRLVKSHVEKLRGRVTEWNA